MANLYGLATHGESGCRSYGRLSIAPPVSPVLSSLLLSRQLAAFMKFSLSVSLGGFSF